MIEIFFTFEACLFREVGLASTSLKLFIHPWVGDGVVCLPLYKNFLNFGDGVKANLRGFTLVEQSNRIKTMRLKGECLHISISRLFLPASGGIFRSDKGNFITDISQCVTVFLCIPIFRGYCLHSELNNGVCSFPLRITDDINRGPLQFVCNIFLQFLSSAVKHWSIIFDGRNR